MCRSSHRAFRDAWIDDRRPVATAAPPDLRVSDAERHAVVDQLSRHTGEGRITLEEFEERTDEALRAKTASELDRVLRGLPREPRQSARRLRPAGRTFNPVPLLFLGAIVAAILFSPGWLWVLVPVAFFRFGGGCGVHERATVGRSTRAEDDLTRV